MTRYENERRLYRLEHGEPRSVPAWRGRRRLRALRALGWSVPAIADHIGVKHQTLYLVETGTWLTRARFEQLAAAYDELSMRLPPSETWEQRISAAKARQKAARAGWPPPLAWDDIDDPAECPRRRHDKHGSSAADVDEAVVERILAGDYRLRATRAEKQLVVERWVHSGRPINDLERSTGWAPHRYREQVAS